MRRRTPFPVIPLVLAHGLAFSSKLKQMATGVAVFLLGIICLEAGRKAFSRGALQRVQNEATGRLRKSPGFGVATSTPVRLTEKGSVTNDSYSNSAWL